MSEYYAVERTSDSLTHYGVKGMKWGVRKAIAYRVRGIKQDVRKPIANEVKSSQNGNKQKVDHHGLNKKQYVLEQKWKRDAKAANEALQERNSHIFDIRGKHYAAYKAAADKAQKSAEKFFDSMTEKQFQRYHDKYLY